MPKEPAKPKKDRESAAPAGEAKLDETLDEELDETFPASDPPASTQPGHGVTGPEVKRESGQR